jgi:hypothetical protein
MFESNCFACAWCNTCELDIISYKREWYYKFYKNAYCRNLNLGFITKVKPCKGVGQKWSPRITFHAPKSVWMCEGMNPTLPSELPLWELEFWWILQFSEGMGQNSLDWNILYKIGNVLEFRCLKWARMTHLDT